MSTCGTQLGRQGQAPGGAITQAWGQAVAVLGERLADNALAFAVAFQLAVYWTSRGLRVALRPALRRPAEGWTPPGEWPTPALERWVRRARQRAHFGLSHLICLQAWPAARLFQELNFDRYVLVGRAGRRAGSGWGPSGRHVCWVRVPEGAAGARAMVRVATESAAFATFCGSLSEAVAYLGCHLMVPCRPPEKPPAP